MARQLRHLVFGAPKNPRDPDALQALVLCVTILVITILEKFTEGGWVTLMVTAGLVALCLFIKGHYRDVFQSIKKLDTDLPSPIEVDAPVNDSPAAETSFSDDPQHQLLEHHTSMDPETNKPIAILFVGAYGGLGRHALLTLLRMFPNHFSGVAFVTVAVLDSSSFKGASEVEALRRRTSESLLRYERYARTLGLRATSAFAIGTEVPAEAEKMAAELISRYPKALFVAGQIVFDDDTFWNRLLHNETAFMVQRRLQRRAIPMVVVPVRIDLKSRNVVGAGVFPAPSNDTAASQVIPQ